MAPENEFKWGERIYPESHWVSAMTAKEILLSLP